MDKVYPIIGIVLCFFLSKSCISDYAKGGDSELISKYSKMISENSVVIGELSSEYRESTLKVMGVRMKTYTFGYTFSLNGNQFSGEHSFTEIPEKKEVDVYYLSTNPFFNTLEPEEKLAKEKEKETSNKDLYWGIGWGILSLITLVGFIMDLRAKKKVPNTDEVTLT